MFRRLLRRFSVSLDMTESLKKTFIASKDESDSNLLGLVILVAGDDDNEMVHYLVMIFSSSHSKVVKKIIQLEMNLSFANITF